MEFGKQLAKYREEHDIDQKDIAILLKVRTQTISAYETSTNKIPYEKLITLCNYYKISPLDLMSADLTFDLKEGKQQEQQILSAYNNLPPGSDKRRIVDFILGIGEYDIKSNPIKTESTTIYRFPVFYQSAAAGIGRLSETNDYQMVEFQLKSIPQKAVFGMYIKGHSMETNIYENDIVLIDPSVKVSNDLDDEIVVALFGEEIICKRFCVNENDQTYDFTSDNPEDKDKGRFHQERSNFTLIGKVVKTIHAHETGNGLFTYSED